MIWAAEYEVAGSITFFSSWLFLTEEELLLNSTATLGTCESVCIGPSGTLHDILTYHDV